MTELEVIICPRCSSENLRKDGRLDDRQIYRCKNCNRKFVFPAFNRPKEHIEKEKLPTFDYAEIKETHLKRLGADNLVDVPCFLCDDQPKCSEGSIVLSPTNCDKMEEWLEAIN